jgi:hypothetical protein
MRFRFPATGFDGLCAWLFLLSRAWLFLLSRAWLFLILLLHALWHDREFALLFSTDTLRCTSLIFRFLYYYVGVHGLAGVEAGREGESYKQKDRASCQQNIQDSPKRRRMHFYLAVITKK